MVILGVVFENLGLLLVIEVLDQVVEVEFFTPFLAIDEPILCIQLVSCILRGDVATYIFSERATSNLRARRNRSYTAKLATDSRS